MDMNEVLRSQRADVYESERRELHALIPIEARNILDLGCSTGALGMAIKARQQTRVHGVEMCSEYAAVARSRLDRVDELRIEEFLDRERPDDAPFDCLIAADVLEHLVDPWTALKRTVGLLTPEATVIVSVPNVLWGPGLLRIIRSGRWPRDAQGVYDGTHLRWFGLQDSIDLLVQAGIEPRHVEPSIWSNGVRFVLERRLLWHTPIRRFLAAQYLLVGTRSTTNYS
jgi:2-polyprenyl-3-methyl-5-hydroxy-6-metoxy-1,4-benzoquinol methylase